MSKQNELEKSPEIINELKDRFDIDSQGMNEIESIDESIWHGMKCSLIDCERCGVKLEPDNFTVHERNCFYIRNNKKLEKVNLKFLI